MHSWTAVLRRCSRSALRRVAPDLAAALKLGQYARSWILPRPSGVDECYLPSYRLDHNGFELYIDEQLARVSKWRDDRYQRLFQQIRRDVAINTGFNGRSFGNDALHNGYYPTPDAEIYAAMILDLQPNAIVEIGSGYSTLVARHAIRYGSTASKLTVIDREPRTNVAAAADEIIPQFVEDTEIEKREWDPNTILFIDSSHVCRARGDLPLLFCKILPRLPVGVVVHVHDIFLPYDYPTNYDRFCYTEQYLLHCLLSGAARYRTMLATHNLSRNYSREMRKTFGPKVGDEPLFSGASYWFQIVG